jgi:hypothetical protein
MKTIEILDSTFADLVKIHKIYEESAKTNGLGYEVTPCENDDARARAAINMIMGVVSCHNKKIRAVVFPDMIPVNGRLVKKDGPETKDLGFL